MYVLLFFRFPSIEWMAYEDGSATVQTGRPTCDSILETGVAEGGNTTLKQLRNANVETAPAMPPPPPPTHEPIHCTAVKACGLERRSDGSWGSTCLSLVPSTRGQAGARQCGPVTTDRLERQRRGGPVTASTSPPFRWGPATHPLSVVKRRKRRVIKSASSGIPGVCRRCETTAVNNN